MQGFIYKITNDINSKIYIGKTISSLEKRFKEHCRDAFNETRNNRPLYKAIRKYGVDYFHIELVETAPIEMLSEREVYWISFYNTYKNGYNATIGGDGKHLYNYDKMVEDFLNGKLIKEIAIENNCSTDTVATALALSNIDTSLNSRKNIHKKIIAKDLKGNTVKSFESQYDAARWLQENNLTTSNNLDNLSAAIGRAANKQRKTAFNLIWEHTSFIYNLYGCGSVW